MKTQINKRFCYCGGEEGKHYLSEGNCYRELAVGRFKPSFFREEESSIEGLKIKVCTVNKQIVSVYDLKHSRGYSKEDDGEWTKPKDNNSYNSLEVI